MKSSLTCQRIQPGDPPLALAFGLPGLRPGSGLSPTAGFLCQVKHIHLMRLLVPIVAMIAMLVAAGCLGNGNWEDFWTETPLAWADDDSAVLWVNHSYEGRGNPFGFFGDYETRDNVWTLLAINGVGHSNELFTVSGDADPPTAARYDATHGLVAGITNGGLFIVDLESGELVRPATWDQEERWDFVRKAIPAPDGEYVVLFEMAIATLERDADPATAVPAEDHFLSFFLRDGSPKGHFTIPANVSVPVGNHPGGIRQVWSQDSSGVFLCFAEEVRFYPRNGRVALAAEEFPSDWTQETTSNTVSDTNEGLPWDREFGTFRAVIEPIGTGAKETRFVPFEDVEYTNDRSEVAC